MQDRKTREFLLWKTKMHLFICKRPTFVKCIQSVSPFESSVSSVAGTLVSSLSSSKFLPLISDFNETVLINSCELNRPRSTPQANYPPNFYPPKIRRKIFECIQRYATNPDTYLAVNTSHSNFIYNLNHFHLVFMFNYLSLLRFSLIYPNFQIVA